jgi:hypothetical protein
VFRTRFLNGLLPRTLRTGFLEADTQISEGEPLFAPANFCASVTGTFRPATYLIYTTTQDGPSLPAADPPLARVSPSGAWVVY